MEIWKILTAILTQYLNFVRFVVSMLQQRLKENSQVCLRVPYIYSSCLAAQKTPFLNQFERFYLRSFLIMTAVKLKLECILLFLSINGLRIQPHLVLSVCAANFSIRRRVVKDEDQFQHLFRNPRIRRSS